MKKILSVLLAAAVLLTGMPLQTVQAQVLTPAKPIVIVLDPGHGGADSGATHKWNGKLYREKDVNLAIARACKKKLETYMGVKVCLTRTGDYFVGLENRVKYAKSQGADLFVSLHNNASLRGDVRGACVYYPNANYNAKTGNKGRNVAQSIQNRLVGLGLKNNGVLIRNSENKSKYPDKSLADYYSVIRNSKQNGFPGLIVEHAYISNAGDCTKYLGSSKMLTRLGEADALGIASYYGLIPQTSVGGLSVKVTESGEAALRWKANRKVDGYCIYRKAAEEEGFELIKKINGNKITQYTDNLIARGVTYEYGICGYHTGGNATTYTALTELQEVIYALPVPQKVKAQLNEDGKWILTWEAADTDRVSGYRIERRLAGEEDYEELAEIEGTEQTSYELDAEYDVASDAEYCVCAYYTDDNTDAESEYSEPVLLK